MSIPAIATELEILSRLVQPERKTFSPAAARAVLKMQFAPADVARMRELIAKGSANTLTAAERVESESYQVVGQLLTLLHSKARLCLKGATAKGALRAKSP